LCRKTRREGKGKGQSQSQRKRRVSLFPAGQVARVHRGSPRKCLENELMYAEFMASSMKSLDRAVFLCYIQRKDSEIL